MRTPKILIALAVALASGTAGAKEFRSSDVHPLDYPTVQAVILLFSLAYVLINLLVDVAYTLLDPRIRY